MVKLTLFFFFQKELVPPAALELQHSTRIWATFEQFNSFKILNYTQTSVQPLNSAHGDT